MNPRRRRMLIPGLLIALLVVVVIASLAERVDAAESDAVSVIEDPRVTESSGLAVSRQHPDLAYTINDSGHEPIVYAIRISTGATVGTTRWSQNAVDPEALALHEGRLWIADAGDNRRVRGETALYVLDEPGPGDHVVNAQRHPVHLDEPADIEALLLRPSDGSLFFVTKALGSAAIYQASHPEVGAAIVPERTDLAAPPLVTDGAFAPDENAIALVSYLGIQVLDPLTWEVRSSLPLRPLEQAESLAFLDARAVLVGSEGARSPLFRVELPPDPLSTLAIAGFPTAAVGALLLAFRSLPRG